jgi:hypothetical protein
MPVKPVNALLEKPRTIIDPAAGRFRYKKKAAYNGEPAHSIEKRNLASNRFSPLNHRV